jgi:hypothetical protein
MRLDQNVRGIRYPDPTYRAELLLVADDAGPPYAGWICYRNADAWDPLRPATDEEKRRLALAQVLCETFGDVRRLLSACRGLLDQAELRISRDNQEALDAVVGARRKVDEIIAAIPLESVGQVTMNGAA